MSNTLLISVAACDVRVALVEDGRLAEFYLESRTRHGPTGNIYQGRVLRLLPGMAAAFVNISSLKSCGVSAGGQGPVDLFTHDDAIFSIACYLKKSGFQRQNRASWRRAVLSYNHSDAYADTILTLAGWY